MSYGPTDYRHYMNLPVCGFCMNAWDSIYRRLRHGTSPEAWIGYCRVGGCDPDVWDFLDEGTGWPLGWKIGNNGHPDWSQVQKLKLPKQDNRIFHRRVDDSPSAQWRKAGPRLVNQWAAKKGKMARRGLKDSDIVFEDESDELFEDVPEVSDAEELPEDIW